MDFVFAEFTVQNCKSSWSNPILFLFFISLKRGIRLNDLPIYGSFEAIVSFFLAITIELIKLQSCQFICLATLTFSINYTGNSDKIAIAMASHYAHTYNCTVCLVNVQVSERTQHECIVRMHKCCSHCHRLTVSHQKHDQNRNVELFYSHRKIR